VSAESRRNGWRPRRLGTLAHFINGRAFKPEEWAAEGLPIIRIQNLTDAEGESNYFAGDLDAKHRVDDGDLLVSWSASLDAFLWDRGPAALNQHIFKVQEDRDVVNRRFLYLALKAVMETIRGQIHGSTMKHITKPKFEAVEVQVPDDLGEQLRVVELLEERLRAAAAVVQRARDQAAASESLVSAAIDAALIAEADDLGTLADVLTSPPAAGWSPVCDAESGGVPVLTLSSVTGFVFRPQAVKFTTEPTSPNAKYWAQNGDLFITRSNTADLVGHAAIAEGLERPTVFPDLLLRLELDDQRVVPEFAHLWLMSATARAYIRAEAVGSSGTMKKVNQKILRKLPFPAGVTPDRQRAVVAELQPQVASARRAAAAAESAVAAADALPAAILREVFNPAVGEEIT
jgi:type I restriction enzyme S subunit